MGLHTCPPPLAALEAWLNPTLTVIAGPPGYGHLLLEQKATPDPTIVAALQEYFRSAHADARDHFHAFAGIDLHPDADSEECPPTYPACLPPSTRRGLFGEVMAGLVTEGYTLVGGHAWRVPIFLFRFHADVEPYLFNLARDPAKQRQVWGRFGNDFVAITLDQDGNVVRVLVGEAKWRDKVTPAVVEELMLGERVDNPDSSGTRARSGRGIYDELNRSLPVPHGLRQLQRLLCMVAPDDYAAAIVSMDRILTARGAAPLPRTDLVFVAGNAGTRREPGNALLPQQGPPVEYTAGRDLQMVEIVLENGGALIDHLYDTLWPVGAAHAIA